MQYSCSIALLRRWRASASKTHLPTAPDPLCGADLTADTDWREKGQGDLNACTPNGGVRPYGLTGTTVGVTSWTGHPAVAAFFCAIALIHVLLICYVVVTALRTERPVRRKVALEVLRVLTGNVSVEHAKGSREIQNPAKANGAS